MSICLSPVTAASNLCHTGAIKHHNGRRKCKMNSVMFKSSFFSCPPLIAGAELPGWQSRGDSSSSVLEFPISLCPIQTAEMCIQTSCLSTKASTDKRRRSDLAVWPGFKGSVLQAECLACRSCQRNGSCSHPHCLGWAPPLGTVTADEMFGLKLRWVLTHSGQQASVTCAQEIIETSQRKLRGLGWPWELLWWQVRHSRASLAWDIPGGSSHSLAVPLGVTGSHRSLLSPSSRAGYTETILCQSHPPALRCDIFNCFKLAESSYNWSIWIIRLISLEMLTGL